MNVSRQQIAIVHKDVSIHLETIHVPVILVFSLIKMGLHVWMKMSVSVNSQTIALRNVKTYLEIILVNVTTDLNLKEMDIPAWM